MHNYRVEEEKTPVDSTTQHHDIDKKGNNYVLKEYRVVLRAPAAGT